MEQCRNDMKIQIEQSEQRIKIKFMSRFKQSQNELNIQMEKSQNEMK